MLIRIVKLTFQEDKIPDFLELFENSRKGIVVFEGCQFVELYQDKTHSNIFFTYSHWDSEMYLEAYRNSSFFKTVWADTKVLFSEKAEAWSVNKHSVTFADEIKES
ncbi:MAG: antibiotic biosynthesis monooxygenase family protein [Bacteroidota bacterium]